MSSDKVSLFPRPVRGSSLDTRDLRAATILEVVMTTHLPPPSLATSCETSAIEDIGQQGLSTSSQTLGVAPQQPAPQTMGCSLPSLASVDLLAIYHVESEGSCTHSDELLRKLNDFQRHQLLKLSAQSSSSSSDRIAWLTDPSLRSTSLKTFGWQSAAASTTTSSSRLTDPAPPSKGCWSDGDSRRTSAADAPNLNPQGLGNSAAKQAEETREGVQPLETTAPQGPTKESEEGLVGVTSRPSAANRANNQPAPFSLPKSAYATLEDFVTDSLRRFCVSSDDVETSARSDNVSLLRMRSLDVAGVDDDGRKNDRHSRCCRAEMERSIKLLQSVRRRLDETVGK